MNRHRLTKLFTLHCAITATNGTPAISCPDSVNAPTSAPLQPVTTPSPVYKPR